MKKGNIQNSEQCKVLLKYLDYLRKSQCTAVLPVRGRALKKSGECKKTLDIMEEVAKECIETTGFKLTG
jgi:hypothetical protein